MAFGVWGDRATQASRLLLALGNHAAHPRKDVWEGPYAALSLRGRLHGNVLACECTYRCDARAGTLAQSLLLLWRPSDCSFVLFLGARRSFLEACVTPSRADP